MQPEDKAMSEKRTVAVILAPGFEEIEAVTIIDVLRRAELPVVVAGLEGPGPVRGSHEIAVLAETSLAALPVAELAMVALPGGMPGSKNLATSPQVLELLREVAGRGDWVAAICAAPLALQAAGLLAGRKMTVHPSCREMFPDSTYTGAAVERDGRVITGSGPGTALRFALALVEALGQPAVAEQLRESMLVR